jgi:predicted PurR-regulated permease PerM
MVALITLGVLALVVLRLSDVIPIVAAAVVLAYLLTPTANFIEKRILIHGPLSHRTHRNLAVLVTYLLIAAAFIVLLLVVIPAMIAQFEEFARRLPDLLRGLEQTLESLLNQPLTFNGEPILLGGKPFIPLERLREAMGVQHITDLLQLQDINVVGTTQSLIGLIPGPAFNFVGGALTIVVNLILLLSMTFFLVRDGAVFIEKAVQITPLFYRGDLRRLLYELSSVWDAYLRGQITLAVIMGTGAFILATVLGVPNPLILALISGVLEFIPSIGAGLAIFPAAFLAFTATSSTFPLLEGFPFALVAIVAWAVLQNIEAIFLVPRIMGRRLNLHPFVVIVGLLAGASLAGVLGIILAAPIVASLRIFGQYIYGKLTDRDPFPPAVPHESAIRGHFMRRLRSPARQDWIAHLGLSVRGWLDARRNQDDVG